MIKDYRMTLLMTDKGLVFAVDANDLEVFERHLNLPREVTFESANLPTELWAGKRIPTEVGVETPNSSCRKFYTILFRLYMGDGLVYGVTYWKNWLSNGVCLDYQFEDKYRAIFLLLCYARIVRAYYETGRDNENLRYSAYSTLKEIMAKGGNSGDSLYDKDYDFEEATAARNILVRFCFKVMEEVEGEPPEGCDLDLGAVADDVGLGGVCGPKTKSAARVQQFLAGDMAEKQ